MSALEWLFFFQSIFYPPTLLKYIVPKVVLTYQRWNLYKKKKKTHHVAGFQNRKVSIKLCPSSVHLITKATIDATFMNKSQLIREMVSHFLIFSTILVCSLSWHVIPTSVKVTSCFLLSQTNDSGLLLCILTLVPPSASCPATIALSFSLISCILGVILSVSFS